MTQDQHKKSLRQFQCRDYLWEIFEQMSTELECTTDYLINEAMRQYARSRNYGTRTAGGGVARPPTGQIPVARAESNVSPNPAPVRPSQAGGGAPSMPPPQQVSSQAAAPQYPGGAPAQRQRAPSFGGAYSGGDQQPGYQGAYGGQQPPPAAQPRASYPPAPPMRPQPGPPSSYPPPAPPVRPAGFSTSPPPLPSSKAAPSMPVGSAAMPPLSVVFNGQKIPVNKEEFVIGRGSKTADLAIKDGNISRRHAAVVLQGGDFHMKDLGSTNGVEFKGKRVDSRKIEEGDVYQICDYELRFTYK